jgi:hypothetical protein
MQAYFVFLARHADGRLPSSRVGLMPCSVIMILALWRRVFDHLWHFIHVPDRTKRSSQDSARRYGDSSPSIVSVMRLVILH